MAGRRGDIVLLLGSRFDGLYVPPGSLTTAAGFVPAEREPCASCGGILLLDDFGRELRRRKGSGWMRDRFGRRQPCNACGGHYAEGGAVKGAGWIARDPMDAVRARVGSSSTTSTARPRRTVTCDACGGDGVRRGERCSRCDGAGRRDLHAFELHVDMRQPGDDPLDAAIEQRNVSGSYRELEQALAGIRVHVNKPVRYRWLTDDATAALRLLDELYVPPPSRLEHELAPAERALVDLAIGYIDSRMPDPIRVPAEVRANARERREWQRRARGRGASREALEQRDRDIRLAVRRGVPVQRVAFEFGLSVSQVNRVVAGEGEAA